MEMEIPSAATRLVNAHPDTFDADVPRLTHEELVESIDTYLSNHPEATWLKETAEKIR